MESIDEIRAQCAVSMKRIKEGRERLERHLHEHRGQSVLDSILERTGIPSQPEGISD